MIDLLIAWYALGWVTSGLWKVAYPSIDVEIHEVIFCIVCAPIWIFCMPFLILGKRADAKKQYLWRKE